MRCEGPHREILQRVRVPETVIVIFKYNYVLAVLFAVVHAFIGFLDDGFRFGVAFIVFFKADSKGYENLLAEERGGIGFYRLSQSFELSLCIGHIAVLHKDNELLAAPSAYITAGKLLPDNLRDML